MTKIVSLTDSHGNTYLNTDDGLSVKIRPKSSEVLEICQKLGCPIIGVELGILDYEYMKSNWGLIECIFGNYKHIFNKYGVCSPSDYISFENLPYDVYKGIKPYMIYLCKEFSLRRDSQKHFYFYKDRRRWFIDISKDFNQQIECLCDIV